jgi:hypothetical protein
MATQERWPRGLPRKGADRAVNTCPHAATSYLTTDAASSEEEQRGHFCPGFTTSLLPKAKTCASTVCVQMGQYAQPFNSFCAGAFVIWLMVPPLITRMDAERGLPVVRFL